MRHELKCWPEFFSAIVSGVKTFEIRKNDRGFTAGDELLLKEYVPLSQSYTGAEVLVQVPYITSAYMREDYVVMSIVVKAVGLPKTDEPSECSQPLSPASSTQPS